MQPPSQSQLKRRYDEAASRAASLARREYPRIAGILVHGSVARGEPGPFSDIDMVVVTNRRRKPSEFSYFDGDIYIGVGFLSVAELEKEFTDPKAFFWARGSAKATRILYDPKEVLRKIILRWKKAKLSNQILEKSLWDDYHNIIEYSGKLRNGWLKRDEYLTRYSAGVIAQYVQQALIALNDISIISENYVWHQILNARKRPKHLRTDYPLALGIEGTRDTWMIYRSTMNDETLQRDPAADQSRVWRESGARSVQGSACSAVREAWIAGQHLKPREFSSYAKQQTIIRFESGWKGVRSNSP